MSNYGLNFGFLRSDESSRSAAEGRFKTPAASNLRLGTMVAVDPATPGFLKAGAANEAVVTGWAGLLLQELEFDRSIYEAPADMLDSFQMGVAKNNRLAVITSGAGTKVWFKNTPGVTRADGRVISAVTVVTAPEALVVGDTLGWNGTTWVKNDGTTTQKVMKVTALTKPGQTNTIVEAVLLG